MDDQNQTQMQEQSPMPDNPKTEGGIGTMTGILITLLVALIAGGGVWAYYNYKIIPDMEKKSDTVDITPSKTDSSDETSNLKTYTNTEQGYSFKYPKAYFVVDDCYDTQTKARKAYADPKSIVLVDSKDFGNNPACESDYSAMLFTVNTSTTEINMNEQKSNSSTDIESNIKVDEVQALKLVSTEKSMLDDQYYTSVLVNNDGKGYTITWKNTDAKGTHNKIIDDIFESFKFSSSSSSSE